MVREKINLREIIKEYLTHLPKHIKVKSVFLFGSYARGNYHGDSDIDLIIISPYFRKMDFLRRLELLSHVQGSSKITRSIPMDIVGYTPEEFKNIDKESIVMREAKKDGKMVYSLS